MFSLEYCTLTIMGSFNPTAERASQFILINIVCAKNVTLLHLFDFKKNLGAVQNNTVIYVSVV